MDYDEVSLKAFLKEIGEEKAEVVAHLIGVMSAGSTTSLLSDGLKLVVVPRVVNQLYHAQENVRKNVLLPVEFAFI
jgi:hypothetical protein